MELGALVLALINLVLAVLDGRRETRPQRERAQRTEDYRDDLATTNRALADGDGARLTQQFERERLASAERTVGGNGRLGTVRLHDDADRDQR